LRRKTNLKEFQKNRKGFYALYFNTKLDVVAYRKIADGGLDAVMVDMR